MNRGHDWIQTSTGNMFWPLEPRPEDVHLEDIAQALSNVCRFTGHTRDFYSVAQHSVLVSRQVPRALALWGLLHDASEAYVADVARPVKRTPEFAVYRAIERRIMDAVCVRFGLALEEPAAVKAADQRMLYTEARDLMGPKCPAWEWLAEPYDFEIRPWAPKEARAIFRETFETLVIP